jgi:MraZ protein
MVCKKTLDMRTGLAIVGRSVALWEKVFDSPAIQCYGKDYTGLMNCDPKLFVFYGHYRHSVDEKGRVAIPRGLRKALPPESNGRFILNIGHDSTIEIHPLSFWRQLEMATLSLLDRDVTEERQRLKAKLSFTAEIAMDGVFRILVPRYMLDYAGLKLSGECVLTGMGPYIELCVAQAFDERMQDYFLNYDKYASKSRSAPGDSPPRHQGAKNPSGPALPEPVRE